MEVNQQAANKAQQQQAYGFYRPSSDDKLDLGFWVNGLKFHWLNPKKHEYSQDRPWIPLTKEKLPQAFAKALLERYPTYFGPDGLHRHAELILGFCRNEDLLPYTKERQQDNLDQLKSINAIPKDGRNMKVKAEFEEDIDLGADAFKNL